MATQRGGLLQFLTMWTLAVSWLTTLFALLQALAPTQAFSSARRVLSMVATPLSVVVALIYWPLITFAPSLMAAVDTSGGDSQLPPAALLFPLPLDIDLGLHAVPVFVLLCDFFAFGQRYSPYEVNSVAPLVASATGVAYGTWVEWCASANGTFPYPFLNVPFPGRLAIYVSATALALFAFRAANALHPSSRFEERTPGVKSTVKSADIDSLAFGNFVWFHQIDL